jgi:hypothetical protein
MAGDDAAFSIHALPRDAVRDPGLADALSDQRMQ